MAQASFHKIKHFLTWSLYLVAVLGGILLFSTLADLKAYSLKHCSPFETYTNQRRTSVSSLWI